MIHLTARGGLIPIRINGTDGVRIPAEFSQEVFVPENPLTLYLKVGKSLATHPGVYTPSIQAKGPIASNKATVATSSLGTGPVVYPLPLNQG